MNIMSNTGKLVAISFLGIIVAYRLGRNHSVSGFTSTGSSTATTARKEKTNYNENKVGDYHEKKNKKQLKCSTHDDKDANTTTTNNNNNEIGNKRSTIISASKNNNEQQQSKSKKRLSTPNEQIDSITMKPIGKISSVYRLCVGTPRQGLLAPNSRGRIDLYPDQISSDSVVDLEKFSHLWIVFIFHLNSTSTKQRMNKQVSAKIAPPALGGAKVGVFATRTPHRPNPVGFSLCKIDKVVIPSTKKKHIKARDQPYSIYVSGLDLVDGTPVLDIKPYVPHYDSVGYMMGNVTPTSTSHDVDIDVHVGEGQDQEKVNTLQSHDDVRIPEWVNEGLDKRRPVSFTPSAEKQLLTIMTNEQTANNMEFYGVKSGRDKSNLDALHRLRSCIQEVLSVDVRSSFQTKKARKGKFQAERAMRVSGILSKHDNNDSNHNNKSSVSAASGEESAMERDDLCTQQLDNLLIKYSVEANEVDSNGITSALNTSGSGADDKIVVQEIEMIDKKKKKGNISSSF